MKIGLIAMSGVRVRDPELVKLGLTLPGFVERGKTIASLPSLGLLTLAALTPKKHDVHYIEVDDLMGAEFLPTDFDLVGISSFSARILAAYKISQRFQDQGTKTVLGGLHVTSAPEEAKKYCDAVAVGEGELIWNQILEDAEKDCLKPFYDGRSAEYNLADAPVPAYEHLDISRYNRLTVQTSRGCPHKCEFCASSILLTDKYKQKPIENVLAEIDRILELWDRPFIEFADDNAFVNKRYWKKLLPHLIGKNIRWFAETDVTVAKDTELLSLMRRSGCAQLLIGFESPDQSSLHGIETKHDWKYRQFDDYKNVIRTIQSHGITVNGCFVIGLDGHTTDVFDAVYEFVREAELYEVQITIQTAFPGTPLYDRLLAHGRILEPNNWDKCTLFDVNFQPSHMTVDELESGFRKLVVKIYSDEFTSWRRGAFRRRLRSRHKLGVAA